VNVQAGEFATRHTFTDHESDGESGLIYANARYYHPVLGRFLAVDPASRDNPQKFLQDPQQLNAYSYVRNNPLNFIDPEGLFTVVVPGTNYNKDDWSEGGAASEFLSNVGETFGEPPIIFDWSGNNNKRAREAAANDLANQINNHDFNEGEQLNIVGHSHGGNIAIDASNNINKSINTLVTLATPVRVVGYNPSRNNIGKHINAYSWLDPVQKSGGGATSLSEQIGNTVFGPIGVAVGRYLGLYEFGTAGRTFPGAENMNVTWQAGLDPRYIHSMWRSTEVWDKISNSYNSHE